MFRLVLALPLPAGAVSPLPAGYRLTTFSPGDVDEVVAVNNAAFDWHPDQAGLTRAGFEQKMAESWFRADGLLLMRGTEGDLAGFCWTKLHDTVESEGGRVGEIYVICTAPDHQGRGVGQVLVLAGLRRLAADASIGMLYVEEENLAARHLYRRLGFALDRVDTCYRVTL